MKGKTKMCVVSFSFLNKTLALAYMLSGRYLKTPSNRKRPFVKKGIKKDSDEFLKMMKKKDRETGKRKRKQGA